jgi:prevent-host-death family protein
MKSVNITELKNRLSVYLNDVKAGEEILVRDRNQPVARIVPLYVREMRTGNCWHLLRRGNCAWARVFLKESFWEMPAPRVVAAALRRAVEPERDKN